MHVGGADLGQVKLRCNGAAGLSLTPAGDLQVRLADGGMLVQKKPVVAALEEISQEFAKETGYQITHHQLKFFGLCPKCQKEGKTGQE